MVHVDGLTSLKALFRYMKSSRTEPVHGEIEFPLLCNLLLHSLAVRFAEQL